MESNSKIKFLGALLIVLLAAVSFSCMVSASDINTSNVTQLNNNTPTDSISVNEVNTGNVTNNNMNSTIYHCTIHSNPSTGYHWEPVVDSKYFKVRFKGNNVLEFPYPSAFRKHLTVSDFESQKQLEKLDQIERQTGDLDKENENFQNDKYRFISLL